MGHICEIAFHLTSFEVTRSLFNYKNKREINHLMSSSYSGPHSKHHVSLFFIFFLHILTLCLTDVSFTVNFFLRRTPSGLASAVRLREVFGL